MIGAATCAGVTHFAIMAANYMAGVCRRKTAVLEWNGHGDFKRMEAICQGISPGAGSFRAMEVDYYPCARAQHLLSCKEAGYQEVIVDFGCIKEGNLPEFKRCDKRFVLGALSEWQVKGFLEFLETREAARKGCEILAAFGSEEGRIRLNKRLSNPVERIPLSADPFSIDHKLICFFERIL